jgi:hypothetical protein
MNGSQVGCPAGVLEAGAFEQSAKVFKRNPSVELKKRALDDVLELDRIDGTRAAQ